MPDSTIFFAPSVKPTLPFVTVGIAESITPLPSVSVVVEEVVKPPSNEPNLRYVLPVMVIALVEDAPPVVVF